MGFSEFTRGIFFKGRTRKKKNKRIKNNEEENK